MGGLVLKIRFALFMVPAGEKSILKQMKMKWKITAQTAEAWVELKCQRLILKSLCLSCRP